MTLTRISSKATSTEAVLAHIEPGADIVLPNANGEPVELVDTCPTSMPCTSLRD